MSIKSKLNMVVLGIFVIAAPVVGAYAHAPSDPAKVGNLNILIPSSGIIFHGRVTAVQYVLGSQVTGGKVPHAFVTYSPTEVMFPSSEASRKSITLRVIGGPDGQGRFLDVEGVPKFSVGDEDILFLRSNGTDGCAVVLCEFGRYRVLQNLVYEAHGSPVIDISSTIITTGGTGPSNFSKFSYPAPSFDELMKNPSAQAELKRLGVSITEARRRYEAEAPRELLISELAGPVPDQEGVSYGMSIIQFKEALRISIAQLGSRSPARIVDADPQSPIVLLAPKAAAPAQ